MAAKAKAKAVASKFAPPSDNVELKPEAKPEKTSIADWAAAGSDDEWNAPEKRQRGGRKKRKKKDGPAEVIQNWDDIYDPSRPNSYEGYKHSEEKIMEVREWKDLLYRHRMRTQSSRSESEQSEKLLNRKRALTWHITADPSSTFCASHVLRAAVKPQRRPSSTSS